MLLVVVTMKMIRMMEDDVRLGLGSEGGRGGVGVSGERSKMF